MNWLKKRRGWDGCGTCCDIIPARTPSNPSSPLRTQPPRYPTKVVHIAVGFRHLRHPRINNFRTKVLCLDDIGTTIQAKVMARHVTQQIAVAPRFPNTVITVITVNVLGMINPLRITGPGFNGHLPGTCLRAHASRAFVDGKPMESHRTAQKLRSLS